MRIADYIDTAAARYAERHALVMGDTRVTYSEARRFVHAVATRLKREPSLSRAAHVAVYSPNDYRVPLLQFGANRADFAWIGVHDRNSVETNAQVLSYMDCEVVFFSSTYGEALGRLKSLLPQVRCWVCIDGESDFGPALAQWLEGCWEDFPYVPVDSGRAACLAPTGGTTGPSKGAVHSHHSLEMELMFMSSELMRDSSRLLSVAPLSHAAGHFALGLIPEGGTNVILSKFEPELVLQTIAQERITHMFMPPTMLYALLVHPKTATTDCSSLTHLIIGAAPVAPDRFKEAIRVFGPVLHELYGQSETGIPVLLKRPADYLGPDGVIDENALRSAGRATTFSRVEIMDDEGHLVSHGQAGEIVVRSSLGMSGYYKDPAATAEVSQFGFHHTGDVGVMDARGLITIVDRKKDMIITGGFNVFPGEVESVINEHPAVLDCIVIGVPDDKWGEAIRAVVQLKPGCVTTTDEIIAMCRTKLGGVKSPKSVEVWPDLPRSAVGKLLRREVRKQYWKDKQRAI